jgi:hypothetical protein
MYESRYVSSPFVSVLTLALPSRLLMIPTDKMVNTEYDTAMIAMITVTIALMSDDGRVRVMSTNFETHKHIVAMIAVSSQSWCIESM